MSGDIRKMIDKVKNFKQSVNENINHNKYYTTSHPMKIKDFIEIEVDERENYEIEDVNEWITRYNIKENNNIIWVALEPYIAARYQMNSSDWNNAKEIYEKNPYKYKVKTINPNDGFLIPESDDGDNGFIFVYK